MKTTNKISKFLVLARKTWITHLQLSLLCQSKLAGMQLKKVRGVEFRKIFIAGTMIRTSFS